MLVCVYVGVAELEGKPVIQMHRDSEKALLVSVFKYQYIIINQCEYETE